MPARLADWRGTRAREVGFGGCWTGGRGKDAVDAPAAEGKKGQPSETRRGEGGGHTSCTDGRVREGRHSACVHRKDSQRAHATPGCSRTSRNNSERGSLDNERNGRTAWPCGTPHTLPYSSPAVQAFRLPVPLPVLPCCLPHPIDSNSSLRAQPASRGAGGWAGVASGVAEKARAACTSQHERVSGRSGKRGSPAHGADAVTPRKQPRVQYWELSTAPVVSHRCNGTTSGSSGRGCEFPADFRPSSLPSLELLAGAAHKSSDVVLDSIRSTRTPLSHCCRRFPPHQASAPPALRHLPVVRVLREGVAIHRSDNRPVQICGRRRQLQPDKCARGRKSAPKAATLLLGAGSPQT